MQQLHLDFGGENYVVLRISGLDGKEAHSHPDTKPKKGKLIHMAYVRTETLHKSMMQKHH